MSRAYNDLELMVCVASRFLEDHCMVVVGTGGPCAATMLAQKNHAPSLVAMFEAGGAGAQLEALPISVGDSRTWHKAVTSGSMSDTMLALARGQVDYCFLGGAQIDPYGNLNSTYVGGSYQKPKVRFPGSGGANDLATLAWRTMVITPQDPRRFVEEVEFMTSPGFLTGPGARDAAGLPTNTGPYKVITQLAVLGYCPETCRMRVESIHPGISLQQVRDATSFDLLVSPELSETAAPTERELQLLRDEVDPDRVFIGR